jgi:WXXGXW repeat (2 copies)
MYNSLRVALLAAIISTGASMAHAQISVGIAIGAPPPPRVVYVQPAAPGEGFVWVQGYWYPVGRHYRWHEGYWTRPPYEGAYWVGPRHERDQFFVGYWAGDRGRIEHDHHWDHSRERDREHERHRDGDHEREHEHEREHDRD